MTIERDTMSQELKQSRELNEQLAQDLNMEIDEKIRLQEDLDELFGEIPKFTNLVYKARSQRNSFAALLQSASEREDEQRKELEQAQEREQLHIQTINQLAEKLQQVEGRLQEAEERLALQPTPQEVVRAYGAFWQTAKIAGWRQGEEHPQ
eukprot:TRINITY_DN3785_c0_g1_i3.p1 TRINITY_DN3785_c0_g1~~TRINITY_DN3785_c0_g1_i3.p1  ORF type:complete len:151 (-),score=44.83 TRINITY_DN3785_c0_g1_i3:27-479(-)